MSGFIARMHSRRELVEALTEGGRPSRHLRGEASEAKVSLAWGRLARLLLSDEPRSRLHQASITRGQSAEKSPREAAAYPEPADEAQEIAEVLCETLITGEERAAFDQLSSAEQTEVLTLLWEEISDAKRTRGFVSLAFWDLLAASSAAAGGGRTHDVLDPERHGGDTYGTDAPRIAVAPDGASAPAVPLMTDGRMRSGAYRIIAAQTEQLRDAARILPVADLTRALAAQAALLAP